MASFRELLSQGKLGEIRHGMSPDAVEQILGPADDRSVRTRPLEILKFGSVELTFKFVPETGDSRLISLTIYFAFPNRTVPPKVKFEDFAPTGDTNEAEFKNFLSSAALTSRSKVEGDSAYLILDSGATIVFEDDRLHSIHVHRADKTHARKQMSVSLPAETVDQLRARAKRENLSVQELIEKVLSTTV